MPDADRYKLRSTPGGRAAIALALAGGAPLALSHMVFGDGAGQSPPADAEGIIREVARVALGDVRRDPVNTALVIAEAVIPAVAGPFTLREVAVVAEDGTIVALGEFPETYKAALADGLAYDVTVEARLEVAEAAQVLINVDPSVTLITRAAVDDLLRAHRESTEHPRATAAQLGFTQLSTPAAVLAGLDSTTAITPAALATRTATTDRTGLVALADIEAQLAGLADDIASTPAGTRAAIGAALGPITAALRPRRARRAYYGG